MTASDIFETIERLRGEGRPFCIATVVRTADATSAKAGAKAAVTASGEILGHLGGACVARAVRAASKAALAAGEPRLIRVKPADADPAAPDWMQVYDSGCPSRGTADILIEPWRPAPRLAVVGDTPIAAAISAHARLAGWRVSETEGRGLAHLGFGERDAVAIASQGKGDAAALRAALLSDAGRVAMIASRRKAAVLRERLEAGGMEPWRFDRLSAPAGLDLGGVDPHEIAIAVLAELVRWRNAHRTGLRTEDAGPPVPARPGT